MSKSPGRTPNDSSAPTAENKNAAPRMAVVAPLVFLTELVLILGYGLNRFSAVHLLIGHLTVLVLMGADLWRRHRRGLELREMLLLFVTTLGLGPVGAIGTLVCILMSHLFGRSAHTFDEWYATLFPEEAVSFSKKVFDEVQQCEDAPTQDHVPFSDIMMLGSSQQKHNVISLISQRFEPAFSPALRMGLRDKNNGVRVLAATTVARIEKQFVEKTNILELALREQPADFTSMGNLARHYDNYAYTGILDPTREVENRSKALELYEALLGEQPDDIQLRLNIARILIRDRRFDDALAFLREGQRRGQSPPKLVVWLAECEFELGHWNQVRELVQEHIDSILEADFPETIRDTARLWVGPIELETEEAMEVNSAV